MLRDNVALATARRARHAVTSHPLSPTKFKKAQPQGWAFLRLEFEEVELTRSVKRSATRPPQSLFHDIALLIVAVW